eukprot:TRINITY_DN28737_c0_g1_i1.p1 TRINITY_DN28737_c0_g1~~TRINITY_DN28737_c0_g1_i1.p1  ORF type:complete len:664 (+),score=150.59 TRINITY_DN28737_c0_g1_i1:33-2024(+)
MAEEAEGELADCDEDSAVRNLSKAEAAQVLRWSFCKLLTEKAGGSLLRGWRTELDPDCEGRVSQKDLCKAAVTLGFDGGEVAAEALLFCSGGCGSLTLVDLAPEAGVLFCRFKRFIALFGSARSFFDSAAPGGTLRLEDFTAACQRHGFEATQQEIHELFCLCDVDGKDEVRWEDVTFLEPDRKVRKQEVIKQRQLKMSRKEPRQAFMAEVYVEEQGRNLSSRHRLAPRPWLAKTFELLPKVICHKNYTWFKGKQSKNAEVRNAFLSYIRKVYGCEVRAWRRGLDPNASFRLSLSTLKKWFRSESHLRESVDLATLWRALDRDGSDEIGLEEIAPRPAETLAVFRRWMRGKLGSCAAAWEHPSADHALSHPQRDGLWKSRTKLLFGSFVKVMRDIGWPPINEPLFRGLLLSSLDYFGCGFIMRSDLEWLDAWEPPEWLYSEPDMQAWADVRSLIMSRYVHPLSAWRGLLDKDDSNSVTWKEFKDACKKVNFKGNLGGAWRALDSDLSGNITLREFDEPSANILESFKEWGETNFGSIELLFKSIDADGSNTVTFPELRRACKNGHWKGDVWLLFNALDIDGIRQGGKRSVCLEEMLFLDSWEPADDEPVESPADQAQALAFKNILYSHPSTPHHPSTPQVPRMLRPSSSAPALPRLVTPRFVQ